MMHKTCMGRGVGYDTQYDSINPPDEHCMPKALNGLEASETEGKGVVAKPSREELLEALENLDDYARMDVGVQCNASYNLLKKFISDNA